MPNWIERNFRDMKVQTPVIEVQTPVIEVQTPVIEVQTPVIGTIQWYGRNNNLLCCKYTHSVSTPKSACWELTPFE